MKIFIGVLFILALIAYAEGVPAADCYRKGKEFPTWRDESEMLINIRNKDNTMSSFSCTCVGSQCQKLDCVNQDTPEEEEVDEEVPVIVVEPEEEEEEEEYEDEYEGEEEVIVVEPEEEEDEGCYDNVLNKYISRGATVIHPGAPSKGCKCPVEGGNDLVCIDLGCGKTMMPTPNVPYPRNMDLRNCFDPWLNQEVADGSSYERVRQMTEYQPLTGTYSCSCKLGVIRCSAIDIPCCDSVSQEFKGMKESVKVDYRGNTMQCQCYRGKSAFRNCRFLSSVSATSRPTQASRRTSSTPSRRRLQCVDSVNGRRSYVGDNYYRYVNGKSYKCTCNPNRRVLCVRNQPQSQRAYQERYD